MLTFSELKARFGFDDEDRGVVEQLEREAVATFESASNRYFGPVAARVDYLTQRGRPASVLRLSAPLVSLTSVEIGGVGTSASRWTTPWTTDYFEADATTLHLVAGALFPAGRRAVRVTYTGGYAATAVPADVKGAVADIVAHRYRTRRLVRSGEEGGAPDAMPPEAQAVARRWYRSPGL